MFIVFCIETMGGYTSAPDTGDLACPGVQDLMGDWDQNDNPAIAARSEIDQYVPEVYWPLWSE